MQVTMLVHLQILQVACYLALKRKFKTEIFWAQEEK